MTIINFTWGEIATLASLSGLALILKLYFLFVLRIRKGNDITVAFLVFGLTLLASNACEFTAYLVFKVNVELSEKLIHIYFFTLYFTIPSIIIFTLTLCESYRRDVAIFLYLISTVLTVLHVNGLIINSVIFKGYAFTRDPASLYWLFELYTIIASAFVLTALIHSIRTATDSHVIARNKIALLGLAPIPVGFPIIIVLMRLDVNVSSVLILPVMTVYLMAICIHATKEQVLDLSVNYALSKKILNLLIRSFSLNPIHLNKRIKDIESISIEMALFKTQDNLKNAAKLMGMTENELRERINNNENSELKA